MRSFVLVLALSGCIEPLETPMERPELALRTLSPGCSGSPYATIQSAINAAVNGDVIEICPGTYNERPTITGKSITLRSRDGAATTIIDGRSGGKTLSISNGANVTVEGLTLVNGSTTGTGGNVWCNWSTLTLRDSVLAGGVANKGGGLGTTECTGLVEGNTVEGNLGTLYGGGVSVLGNSLVVRGNTIRDNESVTVGGGLYLDGDSDILDNTFDGNHAVKNGGAAFVHDGYGDVSGNDVIGNTCVEDGGGIYIDFGNPLVSGNTFDSNVADDEGGGLRVKLGSPRIENNLFVGNHADYRGGAVRISHDDVVMTGNTYIGNSAWVTGGAVLLYESASVLTNETYEGNSAEFGGALAIVKGWGGVDIKDSRFVDNTATEDGGHVYVDLATHTTRMRRVTLAGGSADDGGAIYAVNSVLLVESGLFEDNDASESGGAVYLDTTGGDVINAVAIGNTAPTGAAITVVNSPAYDLTNTVFTENLGGAAVAITGAAPRVRYDDFWGNSADVSGMPAVVGSNGNLGVVPGFVDAATGDYRLATGSALVNAGHTGIFDRNGSRSDIGYHGGPQAP